tara:strand:- start:396 stop:752 length:357 start_codon:yes stop_codon:yes gene_type:complete
LSQGQQTERENCRLAKSGDAPNGPQEGCLLPGETREEAALQSLVGVNTDSSEHALVPKTSSQRYTKLHGWKRLKEQGQVGVHRHWLSAVDVKFEATNLVQMPVNSNLVSSLFEKCFPS